MRLIKFGHACVALEKFEGMKLVIDPGNYDYTPETHALEGADVVLVTHEHHDHFDADRLRSAVASNPSLTICAPAGAAARLRDIEANVRTVASGDQFTVAGFDIAVYGSKHHRSHPDYPPCDNTGFLVDGTVFHPGDALTVPDRPVGTLLLALQAPWLNTLDQIAYLRAVAPRQAFGIHDGLLSEQGLAEADVILRIEREVHGCDARRLLPGQSEKLSAYAPKQR